MALTDILFPDGDAQNFIQTVNRGNSGVVSDFLTEGGSNSGMLLAEVPGVVDNSSSVAFTWVS